ncbi:hypothetical protein [Lactiplantibacillus songbeiensis]|uniref:PepSY domain-containing protein n=1 Tax=Lactiplantibacillus songbeiensis TaxID=2559920 RepID=A0ABW4C068_9LACO|nr:hypothetical protein [Lactiplantibacillus songbeiensis]
MTANHGFEMESFYETGEKLGAAVDVIRKDDTNGMTVRYATRNAGEIKFIFTNMRTGAVIEMVYEQDRQGGWTFNPTESTTVNTDLKA